MSADEFKSCASPGCSACQEVRALRERLGAVEALHYAGPPGRFGRLFCVNCDQYWPCETLAAIGVVS